jgi:hypothetical protein
VEFFKPGSVSLGGSTFTPTALQIIAAEPFCEVDSSQRGALKAWLDVFTSSGSRWVMSQRQGKDCISLHGLVGER